MGLCKKCFLLLFLSVALVCAGCASKSTVENKIAQKWQGREFDDFVSLHGSPAREFKLRNGNHAYVWHTGVSSVTANPPPFYCELQLITNGDGRIIEVRILKQTVGKWARSRCQEELL